MSIEQSVDSQLIEQTKQQIRGLVAEIAQLSKNDISPEEFYGEFLPRVVNALAATGGAVWTLNPEGQLALQYQVNIQETRIRESEERQAQHARLLYKTLAGGEAIMVPPHSGPGEGNQPSPIAEETPAANPTEFLVVLGLLKTDLESVGLVEIFQRADTGPSTQKGYLRFLVQMCELAGEFLKSHQLRHFSHRQTLWTQLEDFTRVVHASLDPRETAYTVANEGRRLVECDRLSVAIKRGNKCKIEAISGQDMFDKRSNIVRLLEKLATAVVATGDAVWYTGDTKDFAPQVEDAVQEYVDEAHSKTVAILPLRRPAPPEEDNRKDREEPEAPIGAIIVEQIEDSRVSGSLVQRSEVVCRHSSTAMANALEHQDLFLMPVWRTLGKTRWVFQARTLPKTLSITGAVLLVLLILIAWQARFTLESKGTLEPVVRQDVFAGIDGVVQDLYCEHGQSVKKDELLVKLRNTELNVALADIQGQRLANDSKWFSVQRALMEEKKLSVEERNRLAGDQAELSQKRQSLEAQWGLYKAKQLELNVKSPINGLIVTWDLRNRLIQRPVQRGQVLLRVADPEGPWQLELTMPENRMGHIMKEQQKLFDKSRSRLREMLIEDAKMKRAEGVTDEEIEKTVDDSLRTVLDENLRTRILAEYRTRLDACIKAASEGVTDEEITKKLSEVSQLKGYEEAWAKLHEILPDVEAKDTELAAKLKEIPREEAPDDRLEVSYIVATEPGTTRYGRIREIHRSAEVRGDEGNTVLIKVAIDKNELPDLRPGATVTAQVYCGSRSLGYVWLHDVIAFIQSRVLFRYF